MAILAGDALLTLAFEVLAKADGVDDAGRARMVAELATASGTVGGMIGGQVNDLEGEGQAADPALLESIHRAKTGALLRASLRMGAIFAGATPSSSTLCRATASTSAWRFRSWTTCWTSSNRRRNWARPRARTRPSTRSRFPAVYGLEQSHRMAEQERLRAHAALEIFGARAARLHELADLIVHRKA